MMADSIFYNEDIASIILQIKHLNQVTDIPKSVRIQRLKKEWVLQRFLHPESMRNILDSEYPF